jgi:hypothetical protein
MEYCYHWKVVDYKRDEKVLESEVGVQYLFQAGKSHVGFVIRPNDCVVA